MSLLGVFMIRETKVFAESAMNTKTETLFTFLQKYGEVFFENYDVIVLTQFTQIVTADPDVASVSILNLEDKVMASSIKKEATPEADLLHIERPIQNHSEKVIGKVKLSLKTDRVKKRVLQAIMIAVSTLVFIEIILFAAIFIISKRILSVEMEKNQIKQELDIQSAISMESKKVAVLVDNMRQGFFSIDSHGIIVEPISNYSATIFNQAIVGWNVMDILYRDLKQTPEQYDAVSNAVTIVMGEEEIQWLLTEQAFPRVVNFHTKSEVGEVSSTKKLKLNISPIWNSDQQLERLLFVVEDISEMDRLEAEFEKQKEQTGLLECILNNDLGFLMDEITRLCKILTEVRNKAAFLDATSYVELLRDLHTMKGNARLLKMRVLSEQIHASETILLAQMSNIIQKDDPEPINFEIAKISKVIDSHLQLLNRLVQKDSTHGQNLGAINGLAVNQFFNYVSTLRSQIPNEILENFQRYQERLNFKSLAEIANRFVPMVEEISNELHKKVTLKIKGDALVNSAHAAGLHDCLVHLIRNSVDHGIESPELRISTGKSESGTITIQTIDFINSFSIVFFDDGAGVDRSKVLSKALKKGIITDSEAKVLTDDQILNLIFLPNFSTKEAASEISGRGLGMDVVKSTIEKMGGSLSIESTSGLGISFKINFIHSHQVEKQFLIKAG